MTIHDLSLTSSFGDNFRVNRAIWSDTDLNGDGRRGFTLRAKNLSGDWVDVVVDRSLGSASTGHIANLASGGFTEILSLYTGHWAIKISRWRPGVFGIPGNGGGDIVFGIPDNAFDVLIDIDVVH